MSHPDLELRRGKEGKVFSLVLPANLLSVIFN